MDKLKYSYINHSVKHVEFITQLGQEETINKLEEVLDSYYEYQEKTKKDRHSAFKFISKFFIRVLSLY